MGDVGGFQRWDEERLRQVGKFTQKTAGQFSGKCAIEFEGARKRAGREPLNPFSGQEAGLFQWKLAWTKKPPSARWIASEVPYHFAELLDGFMVDKQRPCRYNMFHNG